MITLTGVVLVFLLGNWTGFKMAQAHTRKEMEPVVAALESLEGELNGRHKPCPNCGATVGTFGAEIENLHRRVCKQCLQVTQTFSLGIVGGP